MRLLVEHFHEGAADDLALGFRVLHSCQRAEKPLLGVDAYHTNTEVLRERLHHLVALTEA